jgi:DNA-directed RNA polymerase subunit RPC12/RpoP
MSPTLEIPGTVIKLLRKPGKYKCSSCNRDYTYPTLRRNGNIVTKHCPKCDHKIKSYNLQSLILRATVSETKKSTKKASK